MGLLKAEPVAIAAFIGIAINLAVSFGLHLTAEQIALLNALVVAALAIVVRQNVTAPANQPGSTVIAPDGQVTPPAP